MPDKTLIKRYILDFHERDFSGIIPRELKVKTLPGRATVIIGPRRAGKTYYLFSLVDRNAPERYLYVDFEHPVFHPMTPRDFIEILDAYHELYPEIKRPVIMLDEVQAVPDWERIVRYLLDEGYTVYVTGSSSKLLSREVATHLRGRSLTYTLFPLSFRVFLRFKGVEYRGREFYRNTPMINRLLEEYLRFGAYPEVALAPEDVRELTLKDYLDVLIKKDVLERHRFKNVHLLNELLYFSLRAYSKYVSFDSLYRLFKGRLRVTKRTITNYLAYLEEAFVLFLVRRYGRSPKGRIVAPRKLYLIDTGLALFGEKDLAMDVENAVFLELVRRHSLKPGVEITYWKDEAGREVDFVVSENGKARELIQVCLRLDDEKTRKREFLALLHASKRLDCKNLKVITLEEEGVEDVSLYGMSGRIELIPLAKLLLEGESLTSNGGEV